VALRIVEEAGRTDVGRERSQNEDAFLESSPLFCVADGMGGARAGEVASQIAVETLADGGPTDSGAESMLAASAQAANRKIYELAQSDESRSGMGTTLTAVLVEDGDVVTGHVGDSRLYRLREGELDRLTRDHSLVEELVRRGELEPDEAKVHPQRSIITRALGPEPDVDVETFTCPGRPGDVYLLCSDGLTSMVSEDEVARILGEPGALEQSADRLIEAANAAGGKDNITVVLFRLGDNGDGAGVAAGDTLSGQETRADLSTSEVRAAAVSADTDTAVRPPARSSKPKSRRKRLRRLLTGGLGLLAVAALLAGLYVASQQFYFVGTNDRGVVTLYRGVPYDLPLGIDLYSEEYATTVPAISIEPPPRRAEIVDERLRSRTDAEDLVGQLEDGRLAPSAASDR
jgi:serine/threonine protein phosphatase PrpC